MRTDDVYYNEILIFLPSGFNTAARVMTAAGCQRQHRNATTCAKPRHRSQLQVKER